MEVLVGGAVPSERGTPVQGHLAQKKVPPARTPHCKCTRAHRFGMARGVRRVRERGFSVHMYTACTHREKRWLCGKEGRQIESFWVHRIQESEELRS